MADRSKIEWTDATWNPLRGCARVSEGCRNCYAERLAARFSEPGQAYEGLAYLKEITPSIGPARTEAHWTGALRVIENKLDLPLRWKKPRRIFVNSMSDLFYEQVPDAVIHEIFRTMVLANHHEFQVLTKRVKRMREFKVNASPWPQKHIWLGASAENQETYDARRRDLENTNAAIVWWSLEPLIGPIRLGLAQGARKPDWVVIGGESGPGARPMHPDWARRIRDDCATHQIPFFFKQWGEWIAIDQVKVSFDATNIPRRMLGQLMVFRLGKHRATRTLDAREWNQYPWAAVSHGD